MARFVFRVKARGGLTSNMKQIKIPGVGAIQDVIIHAGTVEKAKKLARKQHNETFWLRGTLDSNDQLVKLKNRKDSDKL